MFTAVILMLAGAMNAGAAVHSQCPCYGADGLWGTPDDIGGVNPGTGNIECTIAGPPTRNIACRHIQSGDGYIKMADGTDMYIFGFSDVTGTPDPDVMMQGMLNANFSGPVIDIMEGQEFYLNLSNAGMTIRPDLFDPHTIHFHGYPNNSTVFDGEPMGSIAIMMGSTLSYYYFLDEPGTYIYHCHVEATEHMQMGMLANIFVRPLQDNNAGLKNLGSVPPLNQPFEGFVFNDTDASTGYHVAYPLQISGFDPAFHWANENIQPLPFAEMEDFYFMLNGRGYPDTINPANILNVNGLAAQKTPSLITANQGQKILLRISNVAVMDTDTLTSLGIPMKVVGKGARILRGGGVPTGPDLYYTTNSITLAGGETAEVILDTTGVATGTYFLYSANLNHLSNDAEDFGGVMTEIRVNP